MTTGSASRRRSCPSGRGGRAASMRYCPRCICAASPGDFQEALTALLGKDAPNLSPSVVSRLTAEWQAEYARWQTRDLSARRYVYVWADGVYLQARMENQAECMLVLIGATPEGRKELVGFQVGVRESAQSWRELLVEVKRHGLTVAPELAIGDGALGFWKAVEEIYPGTRHQRCWVHKAANVLNKVPKSVQATMKDDLREIHGAPTRVAADAAITVFHEKYGAKYEQRVAVLGQTGDRPGVAKRRKPVAQGRRRCHLPRWRRGPRPTIKSRRLTAVSPKIQHSSTPDARWLNVGQPEPSTISPLRFSIRRCPMKHSLASRPRPLR